MIALSWPLWWYWQKITAVARNGDLWCWFWSVCPHLWIHTLTFCDCFLLALEMIMNSKGSLPKTEITVVARNGDLWCSLISLSALILQLLLFTSALKEEISTQQVSRCILGDRLCSTSHPSSLISKLSDLNKVEWKKIFHIIFQIFPTDTWM